MKKFINRVVFFAFLVLIFEIEVTVAQRIRQWIYLIGLKIDLSYVIPILVVSLLITFTALGMLIKLMKMKLSFEDAKVRLFLLASLFGLGYSGTTLAVRLLLRYYQS